MDLKDIQQDLQKRFSEPLPDFYKRRIIFWIDGDREFEDKIDEIEIENVKIVKMREDNNFALKKLLSFDDTESNFLVYCPMLFEDIEDNWIADIFYYSEEFRADLISIWVDDMNLGTSDSLRNKVKEYKKFFNAKSRRESIEKKAVKIEKPAHLELAIMSTIAGCDMIPDAVLRAVIMAGLENDENRIYKEFLNYDVDRAFWEMVKQGTGYLEPEPTVKEMTTHIILTAALANVDEEIFLGLEKRYSAYKKMFCFHFMDKWLSSGENRDELYHVLRGVEEDIKLEERLMKAEIEDFSQCDEFPCVDEVILKKLMKDIGNDNIDPEYMTKLCEKRRVGKWYGKFSSYYEGIYYIGKMKEFYNENQDAFHISEGKALWNAYVDKYYIMDTYYRKFQVAAYGCFELLNNKLEEDFDGVVEKAEGLYKVWYLEKLLSNWCDITDKRFEEYGRMSELEQQRDFYKNHVKTQKNRIFVIISDAMRYEVARELAEDLRVEKQCQIEMKSMQGIFPTITSFGMAALLPHDKLSVEVKNETLRVLADGESTESTNREKILKKAEPESVVFMYDDLIMMKRDEKKEKIKGKNVIYIYHDRIDAASHVSDSNVFPECETAIKEIKSLIQMLVNQFSATNIIITADHGFIYNKAKIGEDDKVDKSEFIGVAEYGRRYAVMQDDAKPDYLMPIRFLDGDTGLKGFAPRNNIRIKKQGGGMNYVHGGVSLQEMVVPLIEYHHLRNDSLEYRTNKNKYDVKPVELNLLSADHKISNMIFNLSFYQSEKLSVNRGAANFDVYFVDEKGNKISNVVRVIADRESDSEKEMVFTEKFTLKEEKYSSRNLYYLMIVEESGEVLPKKIEFVIDIPFNTGEFDFFS